MDTIDWEIFSHVIWLSYVDEHTCQQDLQNNNLLFIQHYKPGWCRCENARLPPMWSGFDSGPLPDVGWLCCYVSSYSGDFFPGPRVSSLHKNQHCKFQSVDQDIETAGKPAKADLASLLRLIEGIVRLFHKNLLELMKLSSNKTVINVRTLGNVLITGKTQGFF